MFLSSPFTFFFLSTAVIGSSQSAPLQEVDNTIEQFGYNPATVFKFFILISIIAGVTTFGLAFWHHKKALEVSGPLWAVKVLRKATQQYANCTRSPQPTSPAPYPTRGTTFSDIQENAGTKGLLPLGCNAHLHHPGIVHPVPTYPHQPLPVLPGNHGVVVHSNGFFGSKSTVRIWQLIMWTAGRNLCSLFSMLQQQRPYPDTCLLCLDIRKLTVNRTHLRIPPYAHVPTSP